MGLVRSWLIRGLILAALAAIAAGGWVVHDWVSPEKVREAVVAALAEEFPDADVQVGAAQLRLFGGIAVSDLRLTLKGEAEPFFVAPSAVLSHDKELLSRGQLAMRKVELDGPTVRLDRRADGTWNVAGLAKPGAADRPVPTLVVRNATVVLTDHRAGGLPPVALTAAKLNLLNDPAALLKVDVQGTITPAPDGRPAAGGLAVPVAVSAKLHRESGTAQVRVEVPDLAVGPELAPALGRLHPALGEYAAQFTARVGVKADLSTAAEPGKPPKYDVKLDVHDGRWEDPEFPWPVEHLAAVVRVQDGKVTVEKGTARLGKAAAEFAVETRCLTDQTTARAPLRDDDPFRVVEEKLERLDVTVRDLALDDDLFTRLPPAARPTATAIRRMFSPVGGADLTVRFSRAGGAWKREVDLRPNKLGITYEKFRYPITDVAGWVKKVSESDGTDEYRVQLTGAAGGRRIELTGRVGGAGLDPLIDLKVAGTDVPVDDRIFAALPAPYSESLAKLRAVARGDFVVEIRQPQGVNRCENTFRVRVYDGTLSAAQFPYPLSRVKGYVTVQVTGVDPGRPVRPGEPPGRPADADVVTVREFEAYHGGGRLLVPDGKTEPIPGTADTRVTVRVQGDNLPVDDDLRAGLTGLKLGGALRTLNPRGRVSFGMDVELIDRAGPAAGPPGHAGQPPVAAAAERPAFDPAADLRFILNFAGPTVTPAFLPYDLDDVAGLVRYAGGKVEFLRGRADAAALKARHGRTTVTLESGEVRFADDGQVWADLGKTVVTPFALDADLLAALPPKVRAGLDGLKLTGPMELRLNRVVVSVPPDGPGRPPAAGPAVAARGQAPAAAAPVPAGGPDPVVFWNAELRLAGAALAAGVDCADVFGAVACAGRYDGDRLGTVMGNAWLDRATVAKQPLSAVKVSFLARPQQPDPARPGFLTPPAVEFPDLTATLFGGTVGGEARVVLDDQVRYGLKLIATGVRLDELAAHCHATAGAELRGTAQGQVRLESGVDPRTGQPVVTGGGQVDVLNGRMLNLPFLLPLLKLLKLQAPDQTAFEEAHAVFDLRGDRVRVSQLDLIGTAVSLGGAGDLNTAGDDVRFEFYTIWSQAVRRWLTTPLGDVTSFLSGNLLKIEVVRRDGATSYTPHMLPVVTEPVRAVAERLRNRMNRQAVPSSESRVPSKQ